MRCFKVFLLTAVLVLTSSSLVYAAEADSASAVSEDAEPAAESAASEDAEEAASAVSEDAEPAAESATSADAEEEKEEALYEQVDVSCMVYGEGSERRYEMVVELVNTSDKPLYLNARSFDLEDKTGHLLQSDDELSTAPGVILPGEHGYIYNQFATPIDAVDIPTEDLVFVPSYTVKDAAKTPHDYPVSDVSFKTAEEGYTMVGRVQNDTPEPDFGVFANVIYLDKDGKCLGITGKFITDLGPGETRSFEIASMEIEKTFDPELIGSYKIFMREPVDPA